MSKTVYNTTSESDRFKEGASLYRRFLLMPEKYKDNTAFLKVIMKGKFGGWKLRASLINAFGFEAGNVLFMNNLEALDIDTSDIDVNVLDVGCIAEGEAAEWVLDNEITTGTVFEGEFELRYQLVKDIAGIKASPRSEDAKIAMLILKKGIDVIERRDEKAEIEEIDRIDMMDAILNSILQRN